MRIEVLIEVGNMARDESDVVLQMCFRMDHDAEECRALIVATDPTQIDKWKATQIAEPGAERDNLPRPSSEEDPDASGEDDAKPTPDPSTELSELMARFQETMSGYVPLRRLVLAIMPTMRSAFIHGEVYRSAIKHLEKVATDGEFETYAVTKDQFPVIQRQIRRLREFDRGIAVLPGAVLLSLVATFDSFVADTLRIMLRSKPERLFASSKTIAVKDVLSMRSFDEVIDRVTEDEVEEIMRGSHTEQVKYIEDKLNVDIRKNYDEWGDFVEIFERRNLIAHGNQTANARYIRNCKKHGFDVGAEEGTRLELGPQYLMGSSDRLLEFGLSLMFVLWLKHFRDDREAAYESLNGRTYELIRDGQHHVAARLLDLALFKQSPSASERIMKMMTVNLANAYKKSGELEKAYDVISEVDWSAATDDFQICIAAIRDDVERVVELIPKVAREELVDKADFREWPVFDWVRDDRLVRERFESVFGEPINAPSEEDKGNEPGEGKGLDRQGGATVH
ncbi:MAG: hypothetical protein F4Y86_00770 [Gammaproteobacteria bacterium]|nr:hypothetical protein [Gammaproteobacteria bacterium]